MQICLTCSFVQAKHSYDEEAITRLYVDYRADSYNAERIKYEPTYKAVSSRVGTDDVEVRVRVGAATTWLADKITTSPDFTMLDYGGADGRFLPYLEGQKFVYEVSNITPIEGITRISDEGGLGTYSYIHLAHVLEHVIDPLKLVQRIVSLMKPGAYLYIEVPQEMTDDELRSLQLGRYRLDIPVHEHINKYSLSAIAHLMKRVNLDLVASKADVVDVGWAKAVHLRALGRRAL